MPYSGFDLMFCLKRVEKITKTWTHFSLWILNDTNRADKEVHHE